MNALLDLVLPLVCGGCAAPGTRWCPRCDAELRGDPVPVRPRVDPGLPVWALGGYAGPRRAAVLEAKEHGRRDLARPLGSALALALRRLRRWGEIDPPELSDLALVCAPTRRAAARARGGDPVARMCRAAAAELRPERLIVTAPLRLHRSVRDSVGLTAAQRRRNLAGRIQVDRGRLPPDGCTVVLVDDVLTTGATAAESLRMLGRWGRAVDAVLVVAAA